MEYHTAPQPAQYRIHIKLAKGYELPEWHRAEHLTLDGAQAEVVKVREWAAGSPAIRDMRIKEA